MPDTRNHRGPHSGDRERFAAERLPDLRRATADLALLLDRGYGERAALQLVGDRFALDVRQRQAVRRCCCTPAQAAARAARLLEPSAWRGTHVAVDGFNVLTTVEAALAGGVVLGGLDGCWRDLASLHGTWRRVHETVAAAQRIGEVLADRGIAAATWLLDRPVGNSGRLAALLRELAERRSWPWRVELDPSPDRRLRSADGPVATADSAVLDAGVRWIGLARSVVEGIPGTWIVDLGGG